VPDIGGRSCLHCTARARRVIVVAPLLSGDSHAYRAPRSSGERLALCCCCCRQRHALDHLIYREKTMQAVNKFIFNDFLNKKYIE